MIDFRVIVEFDKISTKHAHKMILDMLKCGFDKLFSNHFRAMNALSGKR